MRGTDTRQEGLFSYVSPESRIPPNHPLREIRRLTDEALAALTADFEAAYSRVGRPSIAPEKLIRALLLQVFYTVRSERLLMESLDRRGTVRVDEQFRLNATAFNLLPLANLLRASPA